MAAIDIELRCRNSIRSGTQLWRMGLFGTHIPVKLNHPVAVGTHKKQQKPKELDSHELQGPWFVFYIFRFFFEKSDF